MCCKRTMFTTITLSYIVYCRTVRDRTEKYKINKLKKNTPVIVADGRESKFPHYCWTAVASFVRMFRAFFYWFFIAWTLLYCCYIILNTRPEKSFLLLLLFFIFFFVVESAIHTVRLAVGHRTRMYVHTLIRTYTCTSRVGIEAPRRLFPPCLVVDRERGEGGI